MIREKIKDRTKTKEKIKDRVKIREEIEDMNETREKIKDKTKTKVKIKAKIKANDPADNLVPRRKIRLSVLNNFINCRTRFLSDSAFLDTLRAISKNLNLRARNRATISATMDNSFNGFRYIDVDENTRLSVSVTQSNLILENVVSDNTISIKDLRNLLVYAQSFKRFPLGSTQTSSINGITYTLSEDMSIEDKILWYKTRNLDNERTRGTQQYIDGNLVLPWETELKILEIPYSIDISNNNPKHPYNYKAQSFKNKIYSINTGTLIYTKISSNLKSLETKINSHRGDKKTQYYCVIDNLNEIYHYNPDFATHLASLILDPCLLVINGPEAIDHWLPVIDISKRYPKDNWSLFRFHSSQTKKDEILALISDAQEVSGTSIYLSLGASQKTYLTIGEHQLDMFSHIMDAVIHMTIPGAFEENRIFMTASRLTSLAASGVRGLLNEQENDLLEDRIRKLINLQCKGSFQENFKSFMNLIYSNTIDEGALYESGSKLGYIYKAFHKKNFSPFYHLKEFGQSIQWNFIENLEGAQAFIGPLAGYLIVNFPQLGFLDSSMMGQSEFELKHQLTFQYYKDGNNLIQIKPGELLRGANGDVITAPRFLMLKNQFSVDLSGDEFIVDTVVYFNDLRDKLNDFKDKGKNFIVGMQGMYTQEYATKKMRKIIEIQNMGGAYISCISMSSPNIWNNFIDARNNIRNNSSNLFHDKHFQTVLLPDYLFDEIIYILNNPADYIMGFEDIIDEITCTAHDYETSEYSEIYSFRGLSGADCKIIAERFGKYINIYGEVDIRPDFEKWWKNFRNSNKHMIHDSGSWYENQTEILKSRFDHILAFYNQISTSYGYDWVKKLELLIKMKCKKKIN